MIYVNTTGARVVQLYMFRDLTRQLAIVSFSTQGETNMIVIVIVIAIIIAIASVIVIAIVIVIALTYLWW
jgi:hypothetical protein